MLFKNITGQRFGKLVAKHKDIENTKKITKWICLCDCGKTTSVYLSNLTRGRTLSCGCFQHSGKHNMYGSKIYSIWGAMIQRCSNPNNLNYNSYGGRGITVCDEWKTFMNFYNDMGDPPHKLTLDRDNNEKGYNKENCRWVSRKRQSRNIRMSKLIEYNGITKQIDDWADFLGINRECIRGRLRRGWSIEKALGF